MEADVLGRRGFRAGAFTTCHAGILAALIVVAHLMGGHVSEPSALRLSDAGSAVPPELGLVVVRAPVVPVIFVIKACGTASTPIQGKLGASA